jgi:hypothetical protein
MANPVLLNGNDYVRVTNNTDEVIEGRYAGVDYVFKISEPVDLTLMAAHHIFGFGGDAAARGAAFLRLGWVHTGADMKAAMKRLTHITFEDLPNVIELVPRSKISRAGPLVAGGTEGAADGALPPPPAPEDPLAIDEPVIGETF